MFDYLLPIAEKYAPDEFQIKDRQQPIIDRLDQTSLTELANAYKEIQRREDVIALSDFATERNKDETQRRMFLLLCLFEKLADRNIPPFDTRRVKFVERPPKFDWSKLPQELSYLIVPAEKYGKYQFPLDLGDFLGRMSPEEEVGLLALKVRTDSDFAIDNFLTQYPKTEHLESRYIYFLLNLLDAMRGS
jgi:hypothetical protein